jgi:hypothetical protein
LQTGSAHATIFAVLVKIWADGGHLGRIWSLIRDSSVQSDFSETKHAILKILLQIT